MPPFINGIAQISFCNYTQNTKKFSVVVFLVCVILRAREKKPILTTQVIKKTADLRCSRPPQETIEPILVLQVSELWVDNRIIYICMYMEKSTLASF